MITFSLNADVHKTLANTNLLQAHPLTDIGRSWWSEAVVKSLDDRVLGDINVDAYAFACERNTLFANGNKEVALLSSEELSLGMRGVADSVASYVDLNVDRIVESSEVSTLVDTFLLYQEQLEVEEGVNLWKLFTLALKGNSRMVDKFREVVARYDLTAFVESVLLNKECVPALEVAMSC